MKNKPSSLQSKIEKRVRFWADLLGMQSWKFKIKLGSKVFKTDEETVGEILTYGQFKRACITINPEAYIIEDFPEALDIAIIHELVHAITDSWKTAEERIIELNFSSKQKEAAEPYLNQAEERTVADLAVMVYNLFNKLKEV